MLKKKKIGSPLALFAFLLIIPFLVLGKDKAVARLTVEPAIIDAGERFALHIEVTGDELTSIEAPPKPPSIQGAKYVGEQPVSQRLNSFTVSNDQGELEYKAVQTQIFTFVYQVDKPGELIVPPVIVKTGDGDLRTAPKKMKVLPTGSSARPSARRQLPEEDIFGDDFDNLAKIEDRFNQLLQRKFGGNGTGGFQALPNINEKDAFFIVAEADKTNVYKGEQITASWYLYTRAGVREIDTLKYPELKGFWKEDIELATLLNFQPAELKGVPYNRALLASYALFPIDDGKSVIDPYRAKVTIVGGFAQNMTLTKNSESIPVLVKPLPPLLKGAAFSGAVGEFQIKWDLASINVVTDQPFSVKIHVEGKGNAKQFELPNLNLPPSVEIYDTKKDSKFFKNGMSYKEFEVLLIPRVEGELVLPGIRTQIFNPRTEKYEEISTQDIKINVLKGSGPTGLQSNRIGADQPTEEKLTLLTQWDPQDRQVDIFTGVWLALFSLSSLGLLIFASVRLQWFKKKKDFNDLFAARLKKIHKKISQEKWRDVGVEVTNLSYLVLGDISGQGGANLEVEKLLEKSPPSVRREIGAELRKVMEKFYLLGFGPDLAVEAAIKEGSVRDDLKKLEKLLYKAIELSHADIPK